MNNKQDINDPRWTIDGPNILSEEHLKRVEAALERWEAAIHEFTGG